jgi:hypothetical protein
VRLVKPHPQIFLFLGETPSDLGRPFVRIQEFYESPAARFRRKFFTLAQFKEWYCRTQSRTGKFTYYSDFNGYNIPGDVFLDWATAYAGNETEDEQSLLGMMGALPSQFYVMGAPEDCAGTIDHELSHAFFHLFPEYKKLMLSMLEGYDLSDVHRYLKANMYIRDVYSDESISYIMFDDSLLHSSGVSTKHLRGLRGGMLGVFQTYKSRFIAN